MATIPMGQGRRVMPGRVPRTQPSAQEYGVASGRALEQIGAAGAGAALDMMAQDTRLQQQELHEQRQLQEAADRQKDLLTLQQTEDRLRDAHDEVATQIQGGTIPREQADAAWTERVTKITGEAAPQFRDQARPFAERSLNGLGMRLGNSIRKVTEAKTRSDIGAGLWQSLELMARQYRTDPAKATEQAMAALATLGPAAGMQPEQIQKARQSWLESTQYTAAFELINSGKRDRKALDAAEKALTSGFPDLDPQKRAALSDRVADYRFRLDEQAEQARRRALAEQEHRLRRAEAEFRSGMALAQEGILDPREAEQRLSAMRGTPYQQAFRQMLDQQRKSGAMAAQPVASVRQALDAVNAQAARGGLTQELADQRETLGKVLAGQERDIASMGGLRAAAKRGLIVADQPLNLSGGLAGVADQLRNRSLQADVVRGWAGAPQSPLYPEEAETLAGLLNAADPVAFGQSVRMLNAALPADQVAAIARQIDPKDKGLALAMVAGATQTTEGRAVAEIMRRGQQAVKDKAPETKGSEATALQQDLVRAIGDAVPARMREDAIEAARLVYYGQKAAGRNVSVAGAVALALGGPIIQHNNRALPVPAGVDAYVLRDRLEAYPRADIDRQAVDGWVLLGGARPMGVPEFLASLPEADLEPAGRGKYTVRVGGALALGKDRRPLVIEVPR